MLVLSRKPGERLVVPQLGLVLTVLSTRGKAVRLGVSAPQELAVYREEVWRLVRRKRKARPPNAGRRTVTGSEQSDERKERGR
jgi:carbon storage regulator